MKEEIDKIIATEMDKIFEFIKFILNENYVLYPQSSIDLLRELIKLVVFYYKPLVEDPTLSKFNQSYASVYDRVLLVVNARRKI